MSKNLASPFPLCVDAGIETKEQTVSMTKVAVNYKRLKKRRRALLMCQQKLKSKPRDPVKPPPSRRKRAPSRFEAVPNCVILQPTWLSDEIKTKLQTILPWFTPNRLRELVIPLISRKQPSMDKTPGEKISMRQICWALIGYSKEYEERCNYSWVHHVTKKPVTFNIKQVYRMMTETNTRDMVAPHRRSGELLIKLDDEVIPTTFAQLHYIYLCSIYGVIDWVIKHKEAIRIHMNACHDRIKKLKQAAALKGENFKRRALCEASSGVAGVRVEEVTQKDLMTLKSQQETIAQAIEVQKQAEALNLEEEDFGMSG